MTRSPQPAPPPRLEVVRPAAAPDDAAVQGALLARAGGLARDVFDWIDDRTVERPRPRRLVAGVRGVIRRVGGRFVRHNEATELRQARALGPAVSASPEPVARVLVLTFRAWTTHVAFELLVGHELRRRGADCRFVLCGGGLPVSELGNARREFPRPCADCKRYVVEMLAAAGFDYVTIDDLVSGEEREALSDAVRAADNPYDVEIEGVRLAPHVVRSVLWVARTGRIANELDRRPEFVEFLESAAIVARAFARLLDAERPDAIVMVSGLFFAEAIMRELGAQRGIRVVTYDFPGRPGTVFASDSEPASFYEIDELWAARGDVPPDTAQRERVYAALGGRRRDGDAAWSSFRMKAPPPPAEGHAGPRLALFTNVSWDTAVTLRDVGFADMYAWLDTALEWTLQHDDVRLDIRVHPGELRVRGFESSDSVADYIRERFAHLPERITVYPPESDVDSYALVDQADAVLVYTSTIGLEAAVAGKPVFVAADVHYRDKGFTVDVDGPDDLRRRLERLDEVAITEAQRERAVAYANLFFFEAMPEVRSMSERWRGKPSFTIATPGELADDPGIGRVCDLVLGARSVA
jgi:hypothetical protein